MPELHPTVRYTDQLREAAGKLRDLDHDDIVRSDDPLTVVRNLHATLAALRDAWPAISESAGFEDHFKREDVAFVDKVQRGLQIATDGMWDATDGMWDASNSI